MCENKIFLLSRKFINDDKAWSLSSYVSSSSCVMAGNAPVPTSSVGADDNFNVNRNSEEVERDGAFVRPEGGTRSKNVDGPFVISSNNNNNEVKPSDTNRSGDALEEALCQLGPFGPYQRYMLTLLCLPNLLAAMYSLNYVFAADQVPFR